MKSEIASARVEEGTAKRREYHTPGVIAIKVSDLHVGQEGWLIGQVKPERQLKHVDLPHVARFVLLLIPKKNREHLIGDLEEEYRTKVLPEYGRFWARVWYWVQTIQAVGCYVGPFIKRMLGMIAIGKVVGR